MNGESLGRRGPRKTAPVQQSQDHYTAHSDIALNEFIEWCDACGVVAPALVMLKWVRTNAPQKQYNNKALAVMNKGDCILAHNFITGETHVFGGISRPLNSEERASIKAEREHRSIELQESKELATKKAQCYWKASEVCSSSRYTKEKRISTHGCRWHRGERCLVVPMVDIDGAIQSVQRIYDDKAKRKRFFLGAPTNGTFFAIGTIVDEVLICEGFATGATLREKTGKPVICALTANNLLTVALAIRARYPRIAITIGGDDDRQTQGNPGRTKAVAAANAVGGKLAMPELCQVCTCTDFNDQANCNARGAGAV